LIVVGSFVAWQALELIQRHGVTKACMVPAMIQMLLAEPTCATTDFSTLEHMVYGGSPITRTCLTKAMERFGCGFAQIYGLTETGNTAVCLRPEDHGRDDLLKAAGRPYPNVRAKVVDASGNPLDTGEVGEVCLHSPANMVGYWKNPEATAQTLIDGWIHTGDAGHIDDEGYVFVSDRIKDMIICAGENIYPAEVESVLASHPAVLEAAVIGVPDERWGELVKAVVVLRPGMSAPSAELLAHCRRDLADFKVPRSVDFTDALPRTPSGKVRKHILRKPYWEGRDRQVN
jgi:long-chain acyl-CoA synthetase